MKKPVPMTMEVPKRKKLLFNAVMISVPVILLIILECTLRYCEYGGNLSLVNKKVIAGKEYYVINRGVGKRYFASAGTVIPELSEDIFEVQKSSKTKRIFCLGESTMGGFPYDFNATAPGFLRDRLAAIFPGNNIEVVNVGLSAVGSYVILDFMKELVRYEPDLFIIYSGHNEFYGAYGVASSVRIPGGSVITETSIFLIRFKTFLLLRDGIAWMKNKLTPPVHKADATLMEQMVGEQIIPYRSKEYYQALEVYRTNLRSMIDCAQRNNIPMMFSSLVSNLLDQPPFMSRFSPETSSGSRTMILQLLRQPMDTSTRRNALADEKELLWKAVRQDSGYAMSWYKLGQTYYAAGMFDSARVALQHAKDLDVLRFRASEDFTEELRSLCTRYSVVLSNVDSSFSSRSAHAVVGHSLILEHLHPNIDGYFLMGKTWAADIVKNKFFGSLAPSSKGLETSDDAYMDISGATLFDRTVGAIKTEILLHSWPFEQSKPVFAFAARTPVEQIAGAYVLGKSSWSEARYTLAEYFGSQKQFDLARKECFAVAKVIPYSYQPLLRIGDFYRAEGKNQEAIIAYQHCSTIEDNPYARIKLSIILIEQGKLQQAEEELARVFSTQYPADKTLDPQEAASARYLFAVTFANEKKFDAAREQLQYALAIQPGRSDALQLLAQIDSYLRNNR